MVFWLSHTAGTLGMIDLLATLHERRFLSTISEFHCASLWPWWCFHYRDWRPS